MDLNTQTPLPNSETNLTKAAKILEQVMALGVTDFCLCAGARNSPFITLIDENKNFFERKGHLYHFFDERSAGFFALGCAQRTQKPVAVITTSGTAVSELLSAAIEAYYTNTPLIFITADRPPTYRGSGAPQSIEQIGIFSHYTLPTLDLVESIDPLLNLQWNQNISLHLNVCFSEPLLDGPLPSISVENKRTSLSSSLDGAGVISSMLDPSPSFFSRCKQPLFIISGLACDEASYVVQQLKDFSGFWWIETLSGLRGHPDLESRRIKSGYPYLASLIEKKLFDGIIRIGSIPTTRLWRDLEDKFKNLPVLSLSENAFSGLSRPSEQKTLFYLNTVCDYYRHLINAQTLQKLEHVSQQDHFYSQKIINLLETFPRSELNLVRRLSMQVGEQPLYLGNSLPIREWDFVAIPHPAQAVSGNRGANGIDGQLSTFLGWRSESSHSWALLGDLTTLYDLNAPWILSQQPSNSWTLAIMNNSGGQIFKPMFGRDAFLNRHNISFNHWAQMWNLTYHRSESLTEAFTTLPQVLEITPCEEQSQKLTLELDRLWKKL